MDDHDHRHHMDDAHHHMDDDDPPVTDSWLAGCSPVHQKLIPGRGDSLPTAPDIRLLLLFNL